MHFFNSFILGQTWRRVIHKELFLLSDFDIFHYIYSILTPNNVISRWKEINKSKLVSEKQT